ncbi:MAG: hypothetical protein JNJ63_03575 [Hyphomonadaceae bacterium]|nr:hypothetical protein [Hyphomonadaceae bacterium]
MDTATLRTLRLDGRPRERGRAHGETLREAIVELLDFWGDNLEQNHRIDRRRYVDLLFARSGYVTALARSAPLVLEEIEGIAEGAGVDFRTLLAFQHVNEEFDAAPAFAKEAGYGEACTTIALDPAEHRPALIAQNLDLAEFLDGFQIMLRMPCDASEGEILTLSVPGMISLNGMNSHGFAVCDNTLGQLRTNLDGVPIFAIYRLLLECRTLGEAQALVQRTPHAVGLNWVMGDPGGVCMIERSASEAVLHAPLAPAPAFHTNHPLRCTDWRDEFRPGAPRRPRPARSTYLRLAAVHQRLQGRDAADLSVQDLIDILSSQDDPDYPVSRGGGANQEDQQLGFTLACNIFELREGAPRWHIASGPPHRTAFRTFGFD